jgi:hypothetical protein
MNTDGTGFNTCKECYKSESLWNHTATDHKEGEQLEDRRNVGESSCNFGDGTDERVHSLTFMMMMMMQTNTTWSWTTFWEAQTAAVWWQDPCRGRNDFFINFTWRFKSSGMSLHVEYLLTFRRTIGPSSVGLYSPKSFTSCTGIEDQNMHCDLWRQNI